MRYAETWPRQCWILTSILVVLGCGAGIVPGQAKKPPTQTSPPGKVDFYEHVMPIFEKHCFVCHSRTESNGGLILDWRKEALKGGDSGRPSFGGTVETNEILRRVSSKNPDERMPAGQDPLPDTDIAILRRWVEQGAEWPAAASRTPKPVEQESAPWWHSLVLKFFSLSQLSRAAVAVLFSLLLLAFLAERARWNRRKVRLEGSGRWPAFVRGFTRIPRTVLYGLVIGGAGFLAACIVQQKFAEYESQIEQLANDTGEPAADAETRSVPTAVVFQGLAGPLVPTGHTDRSVNRTYYRGNCERSDKLFNKGDYRTATFRVIPQRR